MVKLVQNIIFRCQTIAQTIKGNTEPSNEIVEVVDALRKHAKLIIFHMQNTMTPELSAELIKAFRDMAGAMLDEQLIMDSSYLVAIFNYFHTLIVDFFGPLIERFDVCQLIDLIFNDRSNVYQAVFPQQQRSVRRQGNQAQKSLSQTQLQEEKKREDLRENLNFEHDKKLYARIEREAEWRRGLKEGDYLDALSIYKTP